MTDFTTPIQYLKGVGEARSKLLSKLGIETVGDLLTTYPRKYDDYGNAIKIRDAVAGQVVTIKAFAGTMPRENYIHKGLTIWKLEVSDGEELMDLTFFNNPYIGKMITQGKDYLFTGKFESFRGHYFSMSSPKFVPYEEGMNELSPVYPQTAGLTSSVISKLVKTAIESVQFPEECLPDSVITKYNLISYKDAICSVHFPQNSDKLAKAKRRLAFEELLLLQLGLSGLKNKASKNTSCVIKNGYSDEFYKLLPFEMTAAQKRVIKECLGDMAGGKQMNRLIQGDVGSGKTATCAALVYACFRNNVQSALMAPTEVLAQQHFSTFSSFFKDTELKIELITGSTKAKEKKRIKEALAAGEVDLVIGTHALIQEDVTFRNLGLTITDEQHRFGVNQRALLGSKGNNPHTLVMSATPIPRTLSLIIFGDLDISIIDEMPKGRQKTETYLVNEDVRERAYGYIKKHLLEGRQGYIVCPLIESEDSDEMQAAKDLYKELSNGFFNGFKLGILYGSMKPADKKKVMDSFASGETDLLISTTVIEVGVDVPNAVIMVIENAERFGLSQLHQLRGRIGRGQYKSSCILISNHTNDETAERLRIITSTSDGFRIADEDLKLRGPGDFFGSRQHGLPELKIANMVTDSATVRETSVCAAEILKADPALSSENNKILKKRVNEMFTKATALN